MLFGRVQICDLEGSNTTVTAQDGFLSTAIHVHYIENFQESVDFIEVLISSLC
jgi:hypothetical protein